MTLLRLGAPHQVSRSVPAMQALLTLPEYCQLGLVTFGTHVHVHELGFQEFSKAIVFQVRPWAYHGNGGTMFVGGACEACAVCPDRQLR